MSDIVFTQQAKYNGEILRRGNSRDRRKVDVASEQTGDVIRKRGTSLKVTQMDAVQLINSVARTKVTALRTPTVCQGLCAGKTIALRIWVSVSERTAANLYLTFSIQVIH